MNRSLLVLIVIVALSLAGFYWLSDAEPLPPSGTLDEGHSTSNGVASHAATNMDAHATTARVAVEEPIPEQPPATHPFELELRLHMLDEHGLPVSAYHAKLAPPGGALRAAKDATDDHGNAVIRWPSRLANANIELADPRGHRRLIRMQHGRPTHVTMLKRGQRTFRFTFTTDGTGTMRVISNDMSTAVLADSSTSSQMEHKLHPSAVFSEHGLVPIVLPKNPEQLTGDQLSNIVFGEHFGGLSLTANEQLSISNFTIDAKFLGAPETPATGSIDGIVYNEDGKPATKVPVVLLGSGPQPLHRTKTNKSGAYSFKSLKAKTYEVRAGGTELGLASTTVRVDSGEYAQNIHLQRESCIRGSLHDQDGKPIAGAAIEWLSDDGLWADRTPTNANGEFLLANLPAKTGRICAWHKNSKWRLPLATTNGVLPDTGAVTLKCDLSQHGAIRVRPEAVEQCNLGDLRLRVRQVDTGYSRGVAIPRLVVKKPGKDGKQVSSSTASPESPWQHERLPTGFYDVEMALPGCGGLKLGRHWVDAGTPTDLGTIAFQRPGKVHFETPASRMPKDLRVEITALRESFDVRLESLHTLDNDVLLASGYYMLASQRGDQPPRFQRFSVKSDATTVLQLNW